MKVGIITQYYGSLNYGGTLQAYALVRAVENIGYHAEQIAYCAKSASAASDERSLTGRLKRRRSKASNRFLNFYLGILNRGRALSSAENRASCSPR